MRSNSYSMHLCIEQNVGFVFVFIRKGYIIKIKRVIVKIKRRL